MKNFTEQILKFRYLLPACLALALFSCSTTRHLEKKQAQAVYGALGLKQERKDNFFLYREAASWLYVPHVDGGMSRRGTDCSFLVYSIYKTVYGKTLQRNSASMLKKNCHRIGRNRLKEGDLTFFNTSSKSGTYINHVGIYLKDNKFIHASTSRGVMVSSLDEAYFRKTWVCGGRVRN